MKDIGKELHILQAMEEQN